MNDERRGTKDEGEEGWRGFVLVAKLPFFPHLNRSCGEHMDLP